MVMAVVLVVGELALGICVGSLLRWRPPAWWPWSSRP